MKKIITVLATLALVGSLAFAQEVEATENGSSDKNAAIVSFENKLYSPLVDVNVSDDGVSAIFPYLYEQMQVNVESEYVDLEARGRVYLNPTGTVFKTIDATSLWNGFMYDPDNTYFDINFKPGYGIELGLHHSITIPGSVTFIGDRSFYGCESLSHVWYLGMRDPGSSSSETFDECGMLSDVVVSYNYEDEEFCGITTFTKGEEPVSSSSSSESSSSDEKSSSSSKKSSSSSKSSSEIKQDSESSSSSAGSFAKISASALVTLVTVIFAIMLI